jgi:hypothetical protein
MTLSHLFITVNLANIKPACIPTTALIPAFYSSHCSPIRLIAHLSICAFRHLPSTFIPTKSLVYPMVASTRAKNKNKHPAAPVMTEAAKRKAGIKAKQQPKKKTKDQTIRELRAQIAFLKNPEEESYSKEPLVSTATDIRHADQILIPFSLSKGAVHRRIWTSLPNPRS